MSKSVRVIRRLNLVGNLWKSYSERSLSSLPEGRKLKRMLPGWRTMKFRSGNTHENNVASSVVSDMAAEHKATSRGAVYQRRYREKQKKTSKINAKFLTCATELAPELVQKFFEEKMVILIKFYYLSSCVKKHPNIFKPVLTEIGNTTRHRRKLRRLHEGNSGT